MSSYGHMVIRHAYPGEFWVMWTVDYHYIRLGGARRLRYPRQFKRLTDKAGARKFMKRWNLGKVPAELIDT